MRLRACLALVVAAGLTVVPSAGAHLKSGVPSTDFEARIAGFRPAVSGLEARALDGDQRLELRVAPPRVVVVLGLLGEPFLRFSPDGVEANLASPTTTSMGVVAAADAVSSGGVRWRRVSRSHTFAWHEHRLRPLGVVRTHDAGGRAVASFSIPLLVDGRRAALTGRGVARVPAARVAVAPRRGAAASAPRRSPPAAPRPARGGGSPSGCFRSRSAPSWRRGSGRSSPAACRRSRSSSRSPSPAPRPSCCWRP